MERGTMMKLNKQDLERLVFKEHIHICEYEDFIDGDIDSVIQKLSDIKKEAEQKGYTTCTISCEIDRDYEGFTYGGTVFITASREESDEEYNIRIEALKEEYRQQQREYRERRKKIQEREEQEAIEILEKKGYKITKE